LAFKFVRFLGGRKMVHDQIGKYDTCLEVQNPTIYEPLKEWEDSINNNACNCI
jgi:hypothetical protein